MFIVVLWLKLLVAAIVIYGLLQLLAVAIKPSVPKDS